MNNLYDLTTPQKSIWLTEQYYPNTSIGNISGNILIKDIVNFKALEKALNLYVQNNDAIRLHILLENGEPKQYISSYKPFQIPIVKVKNNIELDKLNNEIVSTPFSLIDSDLFKFTLINFPDGSGGLNVTFHHLIADAWTMSLFIDETISYYSNLIGLSDEINYTNPSYIDYILKEKEYFESSKYETDSDFWNKTFEIDLNPCKITNKPENIYSTKAHRKTFTLDSTLYNKILSFCKDKKCSVYTFLLSIYSIYISKINNTRTPIIGTPILNRSNFKEKHTTGMFISTVPFLSHINPNIDFSTYIDDLTKKQISIFRHQKYPYVSILENLKQKFQSVSNLYDMVLSFQNARDHKENSAINYSTTWLFNHNISDTLNVHFYDMDNTSMLDIYYDYQIEKLTESEVISLHDRILHMIHQVLNNSNLIVKDIEIISPSEKKQLLNNFNHTKIDYDHKKNIMDIFKENVLNNPQKAAVIFENKIMTYKELDEKSDKLAILLQAKQVKSNDIIGILLNRSFDLLISIFAVLKTGAAYMLIDPILPEERINYIIKNSNCPILISDSTTVFSSFKDALLLDKMEDNSCYHKLQNVTSHSEDIFTIIYTSGSTGTPKGVILKRLGIHNLLISYKKHLNTDICNNFLSISTVAFDMFIVENFIALLSGKTVILANEEEQKNPIAMSKLIINQKADFLLSTPSKLNLLLLNSNTSICLRMLKIIQVGGEIFSNTLYKNLRSHTDANIYNGYGPSEATACCSSKKVLSSSNITIGTPFCNTDIFVCNQDLNILPFGFAGELCVSGDGVAKGYLNNLEMTKKSFIPNPFGEGILYKTGDIAKINNNLELEYIGRKDSMVKLQGLRIELSEINNQLLEIKEIKNAVTIVKKVNNIDCICSYIIIKENILEKDIKNKLKKVLPYYMVPSHIIFMENLPLNHNGKIDSKRLPDVVLDVKNRIDPKTPTEKKLYSIWTQILNTNLISTDSSFFNIGGDSLSAIKLVTQIYTVFGIELQIKDIFKFDTISKLAYFIDSSSSLTNSIYKLQKADKRCYYPATSAQKRIYYTVEKEENSTTYNTPFGILFNSIPDIAHLETCLRTLINRHPALRTYFAIENSEVVQKVVEKVNYKLEVIYSNLSDTYNLFKNFIKPFSLNQFPLIRTQLVLLKNEKALLMLDIHHIICDGESISIFTNELEKLYNNNSLKEISFDYLDYSMWEKDYFFSDKYKESEKFWIEKLKGELPILQIGSSLSEKNNNSFRGNTYTFNLDKNITQKIYSIIQNNQSTPYMFLLSIYYILLYKYTNQEEIIVGTPVNGRNYLDVANTFGMFVNTLALKEKLCSEYTFLKFFKQVSTNCFECFEHQDYPLEELIHKLNKIQNSSTALFNTMFVYQNTMPSTMNLKNISCEYILPNNPISKFDISLEVIPKDNSFELSFEYRTDLFNENFIRRFAIHYKNIINYVINDLNCKLSDISILTEIEKNKILNEFNNNKFNIPNNLDIIDLFKKHVRNMPNKTAISFEDKEISYLELDKKSNYIANELILKGIKTNDIVGIYLNRSYEIPATMLGILKAGATYIILDTTFPIERISYMLKISNCKLVITNSNLNTSFLSNTILLDKIDIKNKIDFKPILGKNLAIIFTSGSTGNPKGIIVKRNSMLNLILAYNQALNIKSFKTFISICSISFDMFGVEIFLPLCYGKTLVLANEDDYKNPIAISNLICKNKIDFILITPSKLQLLFINEETRKCLPILKSIQIGGEILSSSLYNELRKYTNASICNEYGPSETTSCCSLKEITHSNDINIGQPLCNMQIYICDKDLNLCPIGIPGEICITGLGISSGYINRKDLTDTVFVTNPFDQGLLYKSGDIGKYNENGEIEYVGRKDFQIKLRGLRIELSEIEKQILQISSISSCIVLYNKNKEEPPFLSAFFTAKEKINTSYIKQILSKNLPDYMIPKYFVLLDQFPITTNGKINRKALENYSFSNILEEDNIVLPITDIQKTLCNILENLLNTKIGIKNNFFDKGMDSLIAIKFRIELLSHNIDISYSDIFKYQTVEQLCNKYINLEKSTINNSFIENYDFTKIHNLIQKNNLNNYHSVNRKNNNNVLLLGANGFVGAHIINEFIKNDTGIIYCIIRDKNNVIARKRFIETIHFYFGNSLDSFIDNRIILLKGDITKNNFGLSSSTIDELSKNIDYIINSAADVKHYGNDKDFKSVNVDTIIHTIDFCLKFKKRLLHISSLSVSGNSLLNSASENNKLKNTVFKENNLFINQSLENIYIRTKFEAEKIILEAIINSNLNAQILRLGNITNRFSDGAFQINPSENAFLNRIISFLNIGYIPNNILNDYLEFTPVDICANAIILLLQNYLEPFSIYHIYNYNHLSIYNFVKYANEFGFNLKTLPSDKFEDLIKKYLNDKDTKNILGGIINDLTENKTLDYHSSIKINSDFTKKVLSNLGFDWPTINKKYIKNYFDYLKLNNLI